MDKDRIYQNHLMNQVRGLKIALLALMLMATVAFATPISGCQVINTPGVYEITIPIDFSTTNMGEACIEIQVSDVVIDGNGTAITNIGGNNRGIHIKTIEAPLSNITIKNGIFDGDGEAAIFVRSNNTKIYNNTFYGFSNKSVGIYALGQADPSQTVNLSIYNNTFRDFNLTSAAVVVSLYSDVEIHNNTVYNFGWNVTSSSIQGATYGFLLDSVYLYDTFVDGFIVEGTALQNVIFSDNRIYNISEFGVGARVGVISGYLNVERNNISNVFSNSTGMIINDVSGNNALVVNNTFFNINNSYGAIISGSNTLFQSNTFNGMVGDGVIQYFGLQITGSGATIADNEFYNASQVDLIYILGSQNNITTNKFHDYYGGSFYSAINFYTSSYLNTVELNEFYNYSGSVTRAGIAMTGDSNIVRYNQFYNMSGGGIYVITNALNNNNLIVQGNQFQNFTNGWAITLTGIEGNTGNYIDNNYIANFTGLSGGIQMAGGSYLVSNNTINNTYYQPNYGVMYLYGNLSGTQIVYNNIIGFQGTTAGIIFDLTTNNTVVPFKHNTIRDFSGFGISAITAGGLTGAYFENNTFINFSNGGPININTQSVQFINNTITTTTDGSTTIYGVYLGSSSNSVVAYNNISIINTTLDNASYGVYLYSSSNNIISNNTVNGSYVGISLSTLTTFNEISGNYLCGVNVNSVLLSSGSSSNYGSNNHGKFAFDYGTNNSVVVIDDCAGFNVNLTDCTVISYAYDKNYTLESDLSGAPYTPPYYSAVCIWIENSENITLNCNGHTISQPSMTPSTAAIGIYNSSNITVNGCTLNNYGTPIFNAGPSPSEINENITFDVLNIDGIDAVIQSHNSRLTINNAYIINADSLIYGGPSSTSLVLNNSYIRFKDDGLFSAFLYLSNTPGSSPSLGPTIIENTVFDTTPIGGYNDFVLYFSGMVDDIYVKNVSIVGKVSAAFISDSSQNVYIDGLNVQDSNNSVLFSNNSFVDFRNSYIGTLLNGFLAFNSFNGSFNNITIASLSSFNSGLFVFDPSGNQVTLQEARDILIVDSRGNPIFSINPFGSPAYSAIVNNFLAFGGPLVFGETLPPSPSGYTQLSGKVLFLTSETPIQNMTLQYADTDIPTGVNENSIVAMYYDGASWTELNQTKDDLNNMRLFDVDPSMAHFEVTGPDGNPLNVTLVGLFYTSEVTPDFNVTGDVIIQVLFNGKNYANGYDVVLQKRDEFGSYYVVGNGTTGVDGIVAINLSYNETVPQVFRVLISDPSGVTVFHKDKFITDFNVIVLAPSFSFIDMMRQALLIGENLLILILGIILISMHLFGWTKGLAVGAFFSTVFLAGISYAIELPIEKTWLAWLLSLTALAIGASVFLRKFDV